MAPEFIQNEAYRGSAVCPDCGITYNDDSEDAPIVGISWNDRPDELLCRGCENAVLAEEQGTA